MQEVPAIAIIIIGFVGGLLAMTITHFYKFIFEKLRF